MLPEASFYCILVFSLYLLIRAEMKEEFLHYIWENCLYDADKLIDGNGKKIVVISPGEHNHDSGPDFFNARICIDGTEWAGNVEIHTRSSHFDLHGHNTDHAFDNVILHIVGENDRNVRNAKGEELLTVEIKYDQVYFENYSALINKPSLIACQNGLKRVDPFYLRHWLHSLLVERLQSKSEAVMKILTATNNDWEETFYRMLTRYFGFRVNTGPFEMLARALPFRIIRKHADSRFQIEALLFGTAGLLDEGLFKEAVADSYYLELLKEYKILSAKYSLQPVHGWLWKFSRLRPVNFPTLRISQLASMLTITGGLFSRVIEARNVKQLEALFNVRASEYWDDHYVFGRKSILIEKKTGIQAASIILINAVIPMIFIYGRHADKSDLCERALSFLEEIDPEENVIVREWTGAGIETESAFFSQALLQLTDLYCRKRRCLECRIGSRLISLGHNPEETFDLNHDPESFFRNSGARKSHS